MTSSVQLTSREWNTAVATGLLRVGAGSALLRWHRMLAQRVAGAPSDDALVPALFAYFGVRDIVVGVVTLASTRPGGRVGRAVALQGHADAVDSLLIAGVMRSGRIPRSRGIAGIVVAAGSAVSEYATALRLGRAG